MLFKDGHFNVGYKGAVPKVMSVALIEPVEMTATLNVVVSTLRQAQEPPFDMAQGP